MPPTWELRAFGGTIGAKLFASTELRVHVGVVIGEQLETKAGQVKRELAQFGDRRHYLNFNIGQCRRPADRDRHRRRNRLVFAAGCRTGNPNAASVCRPLTTGIIALAIFVVLLLGCRFVRELAASKAVDLWKWPAWLVVV